MLALERKLADRSNIEDLRQNKIVSHVQLMSRTICYLKGQFAGATPLHRQDRMAEAVRGLIKEKHDLATKLDEVRQLADKTYLSCYGNWREWDRTDLLLPAGIEKQ